MAQKQRQWEAAAQFGLEAVEILAQYQDQDNFKIALRSLSDTWRETRNAQIPLRIGKFIGISTEEAEYLLTQPENSSSD